MEMKKKSVKMLEEKIEGLRQKLNDVGPVMRGSIVELENKCGNKKCRCAKGRKHKQIYFSFNLNGKTKMIFLGKKRRQEAEIYTRNYRQIREIIDEMTLTNMKLLKIKYMTVKKNSKKA